MAWITRHPGGSHIWSDLQPGCTYLADFTRQHYALLTLLTVHEVYFGTKLAQNHDAAKPLVVSGSN